MRGTVLCLEIMLTVESNGTLSREAPGTGVATADDVPEADASDG